MRRIFLPGLALLAFGLTLLHSSTGWLAQRQVQLAWLGQGESVMKRLAAPPTPITKSPSIAASWKLNALSDAAFTPEEVLPLCAIGESDEPGNAFFPLMRAAMLLQNNRSAEALAALRQAASKPIFDDHSREAHASVRAQVRARIGASFTDIVLADSNAIVMDQYGSKLRHFSRTVVDLALKRQLAGDIQGSVALRADLRRVHDLVTHSNSVSFCTLPDMALLSPRPPLVLVRSSRGAMSGGYGGSGDEDKVRMTMGPVLTPKERLSRYPEFLRSEGFSGEAAAFEKSLALNKAKADEREVRWENGPNPPGGLHQLWMYWWGGLFLLASCAATLAMGALARFFRFTQSVEVAKTWRIGAFLAFLILTPLVGGLCLEPTDTAVEAWVDHVARPCQFGPVGSEPEPWYQPLLWSLQRWSSKWIEITGILLPTTLALLVGMIWAWVKKRPVGQGMLSGLARVSMPVASCLLLLWCGGAIWLACEEARLLAAYQPTD